MNGLFQGAKAYLLFKERISFCNLISTYCTSKQWG